MIHSHMTRTEVAEALMLSEPTISLYLRRRWLTAVRVGNRWWIRRDSVDRLVAHGTPPARTPVPDHP